MLDAGRPAWKAAWWWQGKEDAVVEDFKSWVLHWAAGGTKRTENIHHCYWDQIVPGELCRRIDRGEKYNSGS